MDNRSLIIAGNGRSSPLAVQGLSAEVLLKLHHGTEQDRLGVIQVFSGHLLTVIDRCLREGVAVEPDLIESLISFEASVRLGMEVEKLNLSSRVHGLAPVLSSSTELLDWLRELSESVENDRPLTYNDYFDAGRETAGLYRDVSRLTIQPSEQGIIIPIQLDREPLRRFSELMKIFAKLKDPEQLWKLTEGVGRGMNYLHSSVRRAIRSSDPKSEQRERLQDLVPDLLAVIQAVRLIEKFPPSATKLAPTKVDSSNWRELRKLVGTVAGSWEAAFAA